MEHTGFKSMPNSVAAATTGEATADTTLPLFFKSLTALNRNLHAGLRFDRRNKRYGYASHAPAIPLSISEFNVAADQYPIVFSRGPNPGALAMVGIREGENLYVQEDKTWQPDVYIPAYVRQYPFIFIEQPETNLWVCGLDSTAECIAGQGVPLFDNGEPTQALQEAMQLCSSYREYSRLTHEFCRALDDAGLLVEKQVMITFKNGTTSRLDGLRVIDAARFDALDDAKINEFRKRGWLAPIFAHFTSERRWPKLIELGTRGDTEEDAPTSERVSERKRPGR